MSALRWLAGQMTGTAPLPAHCCLDCDRLWREYRYAAYTYAVAIYMRDTVSEEMGETVRAGAEARRDWLIARDALIDHAGSHDSDRRAAA